MRKYEVMYILNPTLDQDTIAKAVANINGIFTSNGSKVLEVKEMGLKDMAYEIQKNRKGYYVWTLVEANNQAVNEFTRIAGYDEKVLGHIVVKYEA